MKREITPYWRKQGEQILLIVQYCLVSDDAVMTFTVRAPTALWHYWLPCGIDYHSKFPMYLEQSRIPCQFFEQGCYCDGTFPGGEELFEKFKVSNTKGSLLNEDVIWNELERWMKDRFPEAL
jgi:hypothetical protein